MKEIKIKSVLITNHKRKNIPGSGHHYCNDVFHHFVSDSVQF